MITKMKVFADMDPSLRAIVSDINGNNKSVIELGTLVKEYPDEDIEKIDVSSSLGYVFLQTDIETAELIAKRMESYMVGELV